MICNNCGSHHNTREAVCPSCIVYRGVNPGSVVENTKSNYSADFLSDVPKYGGLVVFSLVFALFMIFYGFPSKVVNYNASGSRFTISSVDGESEIHFSYQESASVTGYVLDYDSQSGSFNEGGVLLQLHYLSPSDYEVFRQKFGNSKKCPASFYNKHVKHLLLHAALPECRQKLSKAYYRKWDKFKFGGSYLSFIEGNKGSNSISFPSGNYRFFLVSDCS
jgi:hypothetical protein